MEKRPVVRKTATLTPIVAAGLGGQQIVHALSIGRTAVIRKVACYNGQAADVVVEIGTWDAILTVWTRRLPRIRVVAGFGGGLDERECPEFEFETNIFARSSAAGAAALAVDVQVTVDEVG